MGKQWFLWPMRQGRRIQSRMESRRIGLAPNAEAADKAISGSGNSNECSPDAHGSPGNCIDSVGCSAHVDSTALILGTHSLKPMTACSINWNIKQSIGVHFHGLTNFNERCCQFTGTTKSDQAKQVSEVSWLTAVVLHDMQLLVTTLAERDRSKH